MGASIRHGDFIRTGHLIQTSQRVGGGRCLLDQGVYLRGGVY